MLPLLLLLPLVFRHHPTRVPPVINSTERRAVSKVSVATTACVSICTQATFPVLLPLSAYRYETFPFYLKCSPFSSRAFVSFAATTVQIVCNEIRSCCTSGNHEKIARKCFCFPFVRTQILSSENGGKNLRCNITCGPQSTLSTDRSSHHPVFAILPCESAVVPSTCKRRRKTNTTKSSSSSYNQRRGPATTFPPSSLPTLPLVCWPPTTRLTTTGRRSRRRTDGRRGKERARLLAQKEGKGRVIVAP